MYKPALLKYAPREEKSYMHPEKKNQVDKKRKTEYNQSVVIESVRV